MRQRLICANWKMFKTVQESVFYVKQLRVLLKDARGPEVVVAPPSIAVHAASEAARGSNVAIGGQNLHWEREGAFTGEISGAMLREAGAEYVIVGHSERRALFGETDLSVNRKLMAALAADLIPIVCIGELAEQRAANQTTVVLDQQLKQGFDGLTSEQLSNVVLAYEPVWAIGTGQNATPAQAQDAHVHIRSRLRQWFGADSAERTRVIYGGSVKPENLAALLDQPDVDGALIGGASLDVNAFAAMVKQASAR